MSTVGTKSLKTQVSGSPKAASGSPKVASGSPKLKPIKPKSKSENSVGKTKSKTLIRSRDSEVDSTTTDAALCAELTMLLEMHINKPNQWAEIVSKDKLPTASAAVKKATQELLKTQSRK